MKNSFRIVLVFLCVSFWLSFALIFIQTPEKMAMNYAYQGASFIKKSQIATLPHDKKLSYVDRADQSLKKALLYKPDSDSLWLRYVMFRRQHPNEQEAEHLPGFKSSDQALRIVKILNPQISQNIERKINTLMRSEEHNNFSEPVSDLELKSD